MAVRVQEADFDLGAEADALVSGEATGALVTFTGVVRGEGVELISDWIAALPGDC